jgi:hypothetical protein
MPFAQATGQAARDEFRRDEREEDAGEDSAADSRLPWGMERFMLLLSRAMSSTRAMELRHGRCTSREH